MTLKLGLRDSLTTPDKKRELEKGSFLLVSLHCEV